MWWEPVTARGRMDRYWTLPAPWNLLSGGMSTPASMVMVMANKWWFLICSSLHVTRPTRLDSVALRNPWTMIPTQGMGRRRYSGA